MDSDVELQKHETKYNMTLLLHRSYYKCNSTSAVSSEIIRQTLMLPIIKNNKKFYQRNNRGILVLTASVLFVEHRNSAAQKRKNIFCILITKTKTDFLKLLLGSNKNNKKRNGQTTF